MISDEEYQARVKAMARAMGNIGFAELTESFKRLGEAFQRANRAIVIGTLHDNKEGQSGAQDQ
jgi:hypothetical protein